MKNLTSIGVFVAILGTLGIIITACSLEDQNDCTAQSNTFAIVGYNGLVAEGEDELIFGGAPGEFATSDADFNTTFDSLMIVYQAVVTPFISESPEPKGSFFSQAYADCVPQRISMANFIDSVYITSNNDYISAFPAGTDLASIFTVRQFNEDVGFLAESVRIPEFLEQNRAIRGTSFEIYRPAVQPTSSNEHIFTITVEHLNGQLYSFSTPNIIFPE